MRLVGEGYVSVDGSRQDGADGLGLRWSFMGPFETIDLNAPGGVADYARATAASTGGWPQDAAGAIRVGGHERRARRRDARPAAGRARAGARKRWRDRRLMALVAHKRRTTEPNRRSEHERNAKSSSPAP